MRKRLEEQSQQQLRKRKQKDWKDRLIKNKIAEIEKYQGYTQEEESGLRSVSRSQ